ncbi:unnamed protein product [Blepharisma stoltei]|uniref:Uncharacterized protein n=1 Tax=Blepharisma stoltei TaxID=1481888 RepID=A0AAU9JEP7_9CILI|nr:unnamed protein product [Blepharisma stoltei]
MENRIEALEHKLDNFATELFGEAFREYIIEVVRQSQVMSNDMESNEIDYMRKKVYREDFETRKQTKYDLKAAQENIAACYRELQTLGAAIVDVKKGMENKSDLSDIENIHSDFSKFCTKEYAAILSENMKNLVNNNDFKVLKNEFYKLKENLEVEYLNKAQIFQKIDAVEFKFKNELEKYCTNESNSNTNAKMKKRIGDIETYVSELDSRLNFYKGQTKDLIYLNKKELAEKATSEQVERIKEELAEKFSKYDLTKGTSELNIKILGLQKELSKINKAQSEFEHALLKFDEAFLEKASKFEVKEIRNRLEAISSQSLVNVDFNGIIEKIKSLTEKCGTFESNFQHFNLEIADISERHKDIADLTSRYEFLKELTLDIQGKLSNKTDKLEFHSCLESKATCQDILDVNESIKTLHKLIKLSSAQIGLIQKNLFSLGSLDKVQREQMTSSMQRALEQIQTSSLDKAKLPFLENFRSKLSPIEKIRASTDLSPSKSRISPHKRTQNSIDNIF